jgi:hypothetical protein
VGDRQVLAKSAPGAATIGAADDPAEKAADETADKVMRMLDPVGAPPEKDARDAPAASDPARSPSVGPPATLRRKASGEERMPASAPAPGVGTGAGGVAGASGAGPRPDAVTPAGPAPLVAAPAAGGAGRAGPDGTSGAEAGLPAPEAEPPAPAGEQPARGTPEVPKDLQDYLEASRGQGAPLPEAARREFEAKFGRPLDDVGIHDTAQADDAARRIDALAFTRGSDIYFRSGAYDPQSEPGRRLLAHELAHVVQQQPGINRKLPRRAASGSPGGGLGTGVIRRAPGKDKSASAPSGGLGADANKPEFRIPDDLKPGDTAAAAPPAGPAGASGTGTTTAAGKKPGKAGKAAGNPPHGTLSGNALVLNTLYLPKFKINKQNDFKLEWNRAKRTGAHGQIWREDAGPQIAKVLRDGPAKGRTPPLAFQFGPDSKPYVFYGTDEEIGRTLSTPPYDKDTAPKAHLYDIDHKWEHQLGGDDTVSNLWLLDRSANRGSGTVIDQSIRRDVREFLRVANLYRTAVPGIDELKVEFVEKKVGPNPRQTSESAAIWTKDLDKNDSWELKDVKDPKVLAGLKPLETNKAKEAAFGSKEQLAIYSKAGYGRVRNTKWQPNSPGPNIEPMHGPAFVSADGTYTGGEAGGHEPGSVVGHVTLKFFEKARKTAKGGGKQIDFERPKVDIVAMPGVNYGGRINFRKIGANTKIASPIDFQDLNFDLFDGLTGRGSIPKPTVKLLENVDFAVVLDGEVLGIEATITGSALKLPGPFKVSGGAIVLKVTTGGVAADGRIDFEIERLATGHVEVAASTKEGAGGFALDGELNFDSKTFDPARVGVSYRDGKWSGRGELGVVKDKIKGIKSASVRVGVDEERITADGEFVTSIKGVKQGRIGMRYDPATGTEISGLVEFGDLPGIKSGKLNAVIAQGKDGWSLAGDVTMVPSIPGVDGLVTGRYADGGFNVNATLGYARGIAKGDIAVGLTNSAIDAQGKPAGPPRADGALTAYGEGKVTLKLTEWLKATVGLKLKPNGEIEVSGEIALPSTFEVFPEKRVDRKILNIGIDIPILGVAVAGQRIGIFATVRGGVSIGAGFGPGTLKEVSAKVTYNPDRPEETTVRGQGTFYVPASAGLRLSIDGALGAGIPVVSATAGLTVFGEVGLLGAASASAALEWSASKGVTLDAKGDVTVQPKFRFGIEAFVDVSADLWLTTIELYHRKWNLASVEYGPNLAFGMVFPIHYESGKPFELSFDQVQWKYPDINPSELLGGLVRQLVG